MTFNARWLLILPIALLLPQLKAATPHKILLIQADYQSRTDLDCYGKELKEKLDIWFESVLSAIPRPYPYVDPQKQLLGATRDRSNWQKQFALPE